MGYPAYITEVAPPHVKAGGVFVGNLKLLWSRLTRESVFDRWPDHELGRVMFQWRGVMVRVRGVVQQNCRVRG